MKKIKELLPKILVIVFIFLLSVNMSFAENNKEKKTVRVGWFDAPVLHAIDEDGNISGYDYDYLEACRYYTNWEYKYVEGTFAECYEWLKNGDIDLMGIVNKTEEREKIFDFSEIPQGTEYCNLFILSDNDNYHYKDFKEFDGIVVGTEKENFLISLFEKFAEQNNFTFVKKEYPTMVKVTEALEKGEIDAMLASNTDAVSSIDSKNRTPFKIIAQFSPVQFYYVVKKGNDELLNELNAAMNEITVYNPTFSNDLYDKYYGDFIVEVLEFTQEEVDYINTNPEIYILYDENWSPMEYYDEKDDEFKGINPSIISYINEKSGLNIKPLRYKNSVKVLEDFQGGNAINSLTVLSYDFNWAKRNNVKLTQPYIETSIVSVTNGKSSIPKTCSVVEIDYITENVKKLYPNLELKNYSNVEECINAVLKGDCDITFINSLQSEYFMSHIEYQRLSYHTVNTFTQPLCIGVSNDSDPYLFSIINKSLAAIPRENINAILFSNTNKEVEANIINLIRLHPVRSVLIIGGISLSIIILVYYLMRKDMINKNIMVLQYNRYSELIDMVGEILFEYDYEEDKISMRNLPKYIDDRGVVKNYSVWAKEQLDDGVDKKDIIYYYLMEGLDTRVDIQIMCTDFVKRWFELDVKIIRDKNGKKRYAIGKLKNVDDERRERTKLIERASRDSMTNLLNQHSFVKMTKNALKNGSGALLIIDIDDFKDVNDTYGHDIGDEVIKKVAQILKNSCRNSDIAGRIGGDEFAVFLVDFSNLEALNKYCERINKKVSLIKPVENFKNISVSIGSVITSGVEEYEELFKLADKNLYVVKENGKGNHSITKVS